MKKLLISFVIFSALFIIGCQENSITDPVSTESINKNQTTGRTITSGVIPLEGILVVPGGFQSYYSLEGQINYTHALVLLDPIPFVPQYYINLNLSVRADLTDESNHSFRIASKSEDNIYVFEYSRYLVVKSFPVMGRNDGLNLVCSFIVTTGGIVLYAKWLGIGSDISTQYDLNKISESDSIITVTYPPIRNNNIVNTVE